MDIEERLINAGFQKGSGHIPYFDKGSEFYSRVSSTHPHFLFVACIPAHCRTIWCYELAHWLIYNVGRNNKNWEWWWDDKDACCKFEFKEEEDKVKFILRWL